MKIFSLFYLILFLFIFDTSLYAQSAKPVVDGIWKIKSLKDSGKMTDVSSKETHITINTKNKKIHIYAGCNRISSNFEFITADMIRPFVLTETRKSCSQSHEDLESSIRYALEQTNSVRKNGVRIEFYRDNELLIVMEHHADHDKHNK